MNEEVTILPQNAPACASYLRILAQRVSDRAMIEYLVYLGENNTSDFNVRRNTKHTMHLIIRGEDEIDNRVMVYEVIRFRASSKNPNNSYAMMDRDLGAHERANQGPVAENTGKGLVYQFGRKDPFPSWDYTLKRASPVYDRNGADYNMNFNKVVMRDKEDARFGYCGTIAYATAHPMIYIGTYDYDHRGWVYPFDYATNAILWGNPIPDQNTYPDTASIPNLVFVVRSGYSSLAGRAFRAVFIKT